MSFTRIRTINGNEYLYEETRWREGGKVRSKSVCLGRVGGSAPPANMNEKRKKPPKKGLFGVDWEATFKGDPGGKEIAEWEERGNAAFREEKQKWEAFKAKEAKDAHERRLVEKEKAPAVSRGNDARAAEQSSVGREPPSHNNPVEGAGTSTLSSGESHSASPATS